MAIIRAKVFSAAVLLARTMSTPSWFTLPASTMSPGCLGTGALSPVMGDSSTYPRPSITVPSVGTDWPGLTMKMSPT